MGKSNLRRGSSELSERRASFAVHHRRANISGYSQICRCPAFTMGARLLAGCHHTVPSLAAIPIHKIKVVAATTHLAARGQLEEGRALLGGDEGGTARGRYHAAAHQPLAWTAIPTALQPAARPVRGDALPATRGALILQVVL
jgi:hypothetical protein